jgi:hypothetical protein
MSRVNPRYTLMTDLELPPPQLELELKRANFGSMLESSINYEDKDFRAIEHAKKTYPHYTIPRDIYYRALEGRVPLYKFRRSYSIHDLYPWFDIQELRELKKKYEEEEGGILGIKDARFMDELIRLKNKYLIDQAMQSERVKTLQREFHKPSSSSNPSCSLLGGRIKNILRKKNKSNKNKSKRVNKQVKNKRYSRKSLKNSLH